jgi:hypothetical protein|tara:strand:+ start:831 stop:1154 length:324 start_codon:yes stop_codon:yes gene_type:complete
LRVKSIKSIKSIKERKISMGNKPTINKYISLGISNILDQITRTYIISGKEYPITTRTYLDPLGRKISLGGLFRNLDTGEVIIEDENGKMESLGIIPSAKLYSFPTVN